jgi:CO/xanthine dehydrogenase Mo-binding subunit
MAPSGPTIWPPPETEVNAMTSCHRIRYCVTTVDWNSYPILKFPEVPTLEFELIQRLDQPPLGAGEAASTPVAAALGNAVFDATGVRLRTVPFRAERVKAALAGG